MIREDVRQRRDNTRRARRRHRKGTVAWALLVLTGQRSVKSRQVKKVERLFAGARARRFRKRKAAEAGVTRFEGFYDAVRRHNRTRRDAVDAARLGRPERVKPKLSANEMELREVLNPYTGEYVSAWRPVEKKTERRRWQKKKEAQVQKIVDATPPDKDLKRAFRGILTARERGRLRRNTGP